LIKKLSEIFQATILAGETVPVKGCKYGFGRKSEPFFISLNKSVNRSATKTYLPHPGFKDMGSPGYSWILPGSSGKGQQAAEAVFPTVKKIRLRSVNLRDKLVPSYKSTGPGFTKECITSSF
jgi:hypothetical protein